MTGAGAADAVPAREAPAPGVLFLTFLRLGASAFGGPAMIADMRETVVRRRGWLDARTFDDGVVLSQSLPGATAMQVAAWVGLRAGGTGGAVATYTAFGLPAFALMLAFSALYGTVTALPLALVVTQALRVVGVVLVSRAAWTLGRASLGRPGEILLTCGAFALHLARVNPLAAIAACAAAGALGAAAAPAVAVAGRAGAPARLRSWVVAGVAAAALLAALRGLAPSLFDLSALMLRANLLAFGGGFSSLPFLLQAIVEDRHWVTARTFMDGVALGQVTPGPISIWATFVGFRMAGLPGALVATVATFTPSLATLLAAAPHFDRLRASAAFARATRGVAAGFVGLLAAVALRFARDVAWHPAWVVLAVAAAVALARRVDVLVVVLAAAVAAPLLAWAGAGGLR